MSWAIVERDFLKEVEVPRHFWIRMFVAGAPLIGLFVAGAASDGAAAFSAAATLALTAVLLTVPAFFAPVLARERSHGALDVLRSTPLGVRPLVLSIWLSKLLLCSTYAIASLPFVAASIVLGGVTPPQLGAFALVLLFSVLWMSSVSLMTGSLVRNPASASRLAYLVIAVLVVIAPAAADLIPHGDALSPFRALRVVEDNGDWATLAAPLWHHLSAAALTAALALGTALLASTRAHSHGRKRLSTENAIPKVPMPSLQENHPLLWLGLRRGLRLRSNPTTWVAIPAIIIAESLLLERIHPQWTNGSLVATPAPSLHLSFCLGFAYAGLLLALLQALLAQSREESQETLQVLYTTPVKNRNILNGLYLSCVLSAAPFFALAILHALFASILGEIPWAATISFCTLTPLIAANLTAEALVQGLRGTPPLRGLIRAVFCSFAFVPTRRVLPLTILVVCSPAGLPAVITLYPPILFMAPLLLGPLLSPVIALTSTAVLVAIYILYLRRQIQLRIPEVLIGGIDERLSIRTQVRKRREIQVALEGGGQRRPLRR